MAGESKFSGAQDGSDSGSHQNGQTTGHHKHTHKPESTLPLFALNHISFRVKNLKKSVRFYKKVMGFVIIKRPDALDYEGVWMFGHGVAIHLHLDDKYRHTEGQINPANSHISFQCSNLYSMLRLLQTRHVTYQKFHTKIDGKIVVNRINFHDPDGHFIEVADSQNLAIVVPFKKSPPKSMPTPNLEFSACTAKEMACEQSDNCLCCCDEDDDVKADEVFDLEIIPSEYHLLAMNHVGYLCTSLEASLQFYKGVLGFVSIDVPKDDNWNNKKHKRAWLFGHGIGIHLIQGDCAYPSSQYGMGFQCTNMYDIMNRLEETGREYVTMDIKEDGIIVNQISTTDPDGNEIVFCTLHNLPIVPISECPPRKMPTPNLDPPKTELPCKPKWPPRKRKKVEEECYDCCSKTRNIKAVCKPKVVKCCGGDRQYL